MPRRTGRSPAKMFTNKGLKAARRAAPAPAATRYHPQAVRMLGGATPTFQMFIADENGYLCGSAWLPTTPQLGGVPANEMPEYETAEAAVLAYLAATVPTPQQTRTNLVAYELPWRTWLRKCPTLNYDAYRPTPTAAQATTLDRGLAAGDDGPAGPVSQ